MLPLPPAYVLARWTFPANPYIISWNTEQPDVPHQLQRGNHDSSHQSSARTSRACAGLFLGGAAAFAESPAGGSIQVWGTPANNGGGAVVITGAIADSGKSANANVSGVPSKKAPTNCST